jgi:O-antigen/teichoic acid export membrane protein
LRDRVVKSALWLIATRWAHRLVGLASTMVLARLLMPEDFGIVAAVMAVVAILDGFFEFGFDLALIRNKDARREDFDTVWTMRFLKGAVFGLLVMAVSPAVAHYAQDEAVVLISVAIGLGLVIRGFENIGIVQFEKDLRYDRLFAIRLYPRLAGAATTVALAFALRSYWAIVLGAMMQNVYMAVFSYWLCDYRPRLRLQGAGAIWRFSKWILLSGISRKIFGSMDRFLLAGWIDKRQLGLYTVSGSVASMITNELVGAVGNALIPGYAKLQDELARLRAAFLMSQAAFVSLLVPTAVACVVLAHELTAVVLGSQWLDSAHMLAGFAVFYVFYSIVENLNRFMAMTGLQAVAAGSSLVRTGLFVLLIYPAFRYGGIPLLIATKVALSSVEILYLARHCCRRIECRQRRYLSIYWRPAVASAAMAACLWALSRWLQAPELVRLLAGVAVGSVVYGGCAMLLWRLTGRPAGLESLFVDLLQRKGLLRGRQT